MRPRPTAGLFLFVFSLVLYTLCLNAVWATDHATSIVQLDYALWSKHSIVLGTAGTFFPATVDDILFKGNYYSAIPPGAAFLSIPFLGLAFTLAGGYTVFEPVLGLSELFVAITAALGVYFTYRIALKYFRRSTSIFIGLALGVSSVVWPFATFFFQSDVSAMFVTLAVLLLLNVNGSKPSSWMVSLACGFVAGFAVTIDYVSAVLVPIFFVYLIARRKSAGVRARSIASFVLGTLPGIGSVFLYNFIAFGSPFLPTEQVYLGTQSILGGFTNPIQDGVLLLLFSPARGLVYFVPLVILGMMGFYESLRTGRHRGDFLLFLAVFLGILLPYSAYFNPEGGLSYGPRFIVASIPFLLIPAGLVIEQANRVPMALVYSLFLVGAVTNGMAAVVTAIPPATIAQVSPFTTYILPDFLSGRFDSVWRYNPYSISIAVAIIAVASVAPILFTYYLRRRERRIDAELGQRKRNLV